MSWSIIDLKNNIFEMFDEEQINLVSAPLNSIFENQHFAHYHYVELQRLISLHVDGQKINNDYVRLVLTNNIDVKNQEHEFKIACKANIMAILRNLHCITDLLAHVIYYSLGLNKKGNTELDLKYLSLKKVRDKLNKVQGSNSLIEELDKFTKHRDYIYLNGLVNHSKHRANITSKLTYELRQTGKEVYRFLFPPFEYDKIKYEKEPVDSFLQNEYGRQSEQIIIIGNKINSLVERMLTIA